jgi:cytosine/adenosine deaminase-related metal-dependent hydrolase
VVERLAKHGALNERTILAHAVHLDDSQLEIARRAGVWLVHNTRSNMNNRVGYAPVHKFDKRLALGTDGIGADLFEEARVAFFKAREADTGWGAGEWLSALANNQQMASEAFGVRIGSLEAGAAADLITLDYKSPTPLTAENLAWHFIFGFSSASVENVMVNGSFVIRDRQPALDEPVLYEQIRKASEKLWKKLERI